MEYTEAHDMEIAILESYEKKGGLTVIGKEKLEKLRRCRAAVKSSEDALIDRKDPAIIKLHSLSLRLLNVHNDKEGCDSLMGVVSDLLSRNKVSS